MAGKWKGGTLGICIAMLAVMGMVATGYLTAVSEQTVQKTSYEYVTDVSGLFEYTDDPSFISYDPSANWTGFYTDNASVTSGISYTVSASANLYPLKQEYTTVATTELSDLSSTLTGDWPSTNANHVTALISETDDGVSIDTSETALQMEEGYYYTGYWLDGSGRTATLSSLLNLITLDDETDYLRIELCVNGGIFAAPKGDWNFDSILNIDMTTGSVTTTAIYWITSDWLAEAYMIVNLSTSIVTIYDADGSSMWTGSSSDLMVAANLAYLDGVSSCTESDVTERMSNSTTIMQLADASATYMDISQGLTQTEDMTWANGYLNSSVDILFRLPSVGSIYSQTIAFNLTDTGGASTGEVLTLTVEAASSGYVSVYIESSDGSYTLEFGAWRNFVVHIDTVNGKYTVTPVTSFTSFNTYTLLETQTASMDLDTSGYAFYTTDWTLNFTSFTFGIVGTSVFMNTYDAVMSDASLDITDYFTNLASYRLNLYSFALYGTSVTINGTVYEMDGQEIVVDGTAYELSNVYITWEAGRTYLTFVADGETIDLGTTVSTELEFGGTWYFTTGLWEGVTTTGTELSWDAGTWILDSTGAIAVFLGILVLGAIVGTVMGKMQWYDYLILAIAGIVGWVLL